MRKWEEREPRIILDICTLLYTDKEEVRAKYNALVMGWGWIIQVGHGFSLNAVF